MRWRLAAILSVGVNFLLIAWVISSHRNAARYAAAMNALTADLSGTSKTNYLVRRQPFAWKQLESPDYAVYIANLRDIGCPEETIRDIVIADVDALYARRRATELVTSEQQWWRSEPDPEVVRLAAAKVQALEEERRALLSKLLGVTWDSSGIASAPQPSETGVLLDGAILGPLPNDTKQQIQDVNLRSQQRLDQYIAEQRRAGKEPDLAVLAKLRQQTRDELANILPPPQLEEFLLRYSQDANNMRAEFGQLQYFNPSQEEFRQVFRATDALDQKIQLLADAADPSSVSQRSALEDQRENAIKIALGPKRYEEYRMLHDPLYREAVAAAQQAGTPDAVATMYAVKLAAAAEQSSIQSDSSLTAEQRDVETKRLELQQAQANALAAGQDLPPEPPDVPAAPPPRKIIVLGPGDSAATIAMMYGLPVQAILAANPRVNFSKLKPGQAITIPPSPLAPRYGP